MRNLFNNAHIQLLIHAFQNDPMFVALFKGSRQQRQLQAFFRLIYIRNQLMDGIYLTDSSDHPTYVAFIEKPQGRQHHRFLNQIQLYLEMLKSAFYIPLKTLHFLSRYEAAMKQRRPRSKHYYLTMIGVAPEKQGQGIGKMIIKSIHDTCMDDPKAAGICLDTVNWNNVFYYEHLGYSLIHTVNISRITIYCMQRLKD